MEGPDALRIRRFSWTFRAIPDITARERGIDAATSACVPMIPDNRGLGHMSDGRGGLSDLPPPRLRPLRPHIRPIAAIRHLSGGLHGCVGPAGPVTRRPNAMPVSRQDKATRSIVRRRSS
ncbi:hypothetical protein GCM10011505_12610 [Tistrella bauzanensis]|uniref:Uncharacterized protein n=1 Tax=Tistrella bauzanensis TaxID=657419 RepID=A0ABQ1IBL4_9PROT|nr:hypothetical protein GCM10011505_12610 [Tistrella bauzanensis]